jgi:hypothetical protein
MLTGLLQGVGVTLGNRMTKLLAKLAENVPFALVLLGVAIFLVGAAGGLPAAHLAVAEGGWRVALGVLGGVVLLGGALLLWRGSPVEAAISPARYHIKIRGPIAGELVGRRFQIHGTYSGKLPPGYALEIFEINESRSDYRPRRRANINNDGTWRAVEVWGGTRSGESKLYMVALAGPCGQLLTEYYRAVGDRFKEFDKTRPPVNRLPADVHECDRVRVTLQ